MKVVMWVQCETHMRKVQPAGDEWHFTEIARTGMWELDLADTWCPVPALRDKPHKYVVGFSVGEGVE